MRNILKKLFIATLLSSIITFIIGFCINLDSEKLDLTQYIEDNVKDIEKLKNGYITTSNDSWFKINNIKDSYNYIELEIDNLEKDTLLSVYYSIGENFSEDKRIDCELKNGKNIVSLHKDQNFDTLRFDIGSEEDIKFTIDSLNLVNEVSNNKFILSSFAFIFILLLIVFCLIK